jgi:SOS-response transcriptional repressor LexA
MPHRDTPEPLTRRQQEWLDVIREHYERTGRAATRMELSVAMGRISGSAAAYACEVLEKKGYLVQVHAPNGSWQYLPAERAGDAGRSMTVEEVADWVREVDNRTLPLLRDAIEAEMRRRKRKGAEGVGEGPCVPT